MSLQLWEMMPLVLLCDCKCKMTSSLFGPMMRCTVMLMCALPSAKSNRQDLMLHQALDAGRQVLFS